MMTRTRTTIGLWTVAVGLAGCGDVRSPSAPTAQPSLIQQPSPPPSGIQPSVTAMAPRVGSTLGGAWPRITGADFQPGATVRLGESRLTASVIDSQTIAILTPPHVAGTVDVIVTNPGGLEDRLFGGYRYEPPETFDFNGDWVVHVGPDYEMDMRFTIRNNVLISLSCNISPPLALALTLSVSNGEFSFQGDDGLTMSARLVSPVSAVGTINVPDVPVCRAARWWADKE